MNTVQPTVKPGVKKKLGWEKIYSEGHVWVARLSDLAVNSVSFFPKKARSSAVKLAVCGLLGVVVSVGAAGAGAALKTWAPESMFAAPEKITYQDRLGDIFRMVANDSSPTSTAVTLAVLEARQEDGKPLAHKVIKQYLAGSANPSDFALAKSFDEPWQHNKVMVVQTENGTWFGFRYKISLENYTETDSAAIFFAAKDGGVYHVASSQRRALGETYKLSQMPRESISAGIYREIQK